MSHTVKILIQNPFGLLIPHMGLSIAASHHP